MGDGLRKATAAVYGVKIGQFWADNDPRLKTPRTLEVLAFEADPNGSLRVRCHVHESGREVWIKLSRFRATKNGYRLLPHDPTQLTVAAIRKMVAGLRDGGVIKPLVGHKITVFYDAAPEPGKPTDETFPAQHKTVVMVEADAMTTTITTPAPPLNGRPRLRIKADEPLNAAIASANDDLLMEGCMECSACGGWILYHKAGCPADDAPSPDGQPHRFKDELPLAAPYGITSETLRKMTDQLIGSSATCRECGGFLQHKAGCRYDDSPRG